MSKSKECPYCQSKKGYCYEESVKVKYYYDFYGLLYDQTTCETIYSSTTRRCIDCGRKITSYVDSLHLTEVKNEKT
jgi:hypothetical protein